MSVRFQVIVAFELFSGFGGDSKPRNNNRFKCKQSGHFAREGPNDGMSGGELYFSCISLANNKTEKVSSDSAGQVRPFGKRSFISKSHKIPIEI